MTVNHDIKTQLAKLLATENFIVEHRDVKTAAFNVHTRVLSLPLWKLASNTVYDVLVAHECSHALFTPNEDWTLKVDLPKQFVNVVEDARIEKLMKRKYPGLAKTFYQGYKELNDDDFFDIVNEDIDTFNLADRANLYFKVGHFVDLDFSPREKQIISLVEECETFDDTLRVAEILHEYCKNPLQTEEEEKVESKVMEPDDEEGDTFDKEFFDDGKEKEEKEPEVKTDNALNENLQELNDPVDHLENIYCEVPEVNLDSVIVSNHSIHEKLNDFFDQQFKGGCDADVVDREYQKFKRAAQKEVNYLVKEFECKKSANDYARTSVSKTGVLDCSKLHSYKYNEDLFRKVNIVPDGKNHGLIFLLDWSGSMADCLMDTIKQLYNLIWFCKKVQIPFEVYAFTNAYNRTEFDDKGNPVRCSIHMEKKENLIRVGQDFKLLNWLSSKVNKSILENHMINLWRVAASICHRYYPSYSIAYMVLPEFYLSGTPLHESLISLYQIIPQFKKDNNLQKVQCIVLSDGEANPLPAYKYRGGRYEDEIELRPTILRPGRSFLRNRKTGHVYKIESPFWAFTEVLLKDLNQMYPDVNFIGIRLLAGRDFGHFIKRYCPNTSETVIKMFRKQKSVTIKGTGYHSYFGMLSSGLYDDPEFEVAPYASKAQIKHAFARSLKTKKLNKKVLGEFISLVA